VEESEHEASTDLSKEVSVDNNDIDDDDVEDEDDDDFDSECSAMSNIDSKTDQFVDQFRNETRSLIAAGETMFFELMSIDGVAASDATGTHDVDIQAEEVRKPDRTERDLRKLAIKTEIEKLNSMQEAKETSVAETEEVLLQVQQQLAEIQKSILVSFGVTYR
jgi:hypothetical protein